MLEAIRIFAVPIFSLLRLCVFSFLFIPRRSLFTTLRLHSYLRDDFENVFLSEIAAIEKADSSALTEIISERNFKYFYIILFISIIRNIFIVSRIIIFTCVKAMFFSNNYFLRFFTIFYDFSLFFIFFAFCFFFFLPLIFKAISILILVQKSFRETLGVKRL